MYAVNVDPAWDLDAWRMVARKALLSGVTPHDLSWNGDTQGGFDFGGSLEALPIIRKNPRVSQEFLKVAGGVLCHRDVSRHALLYRILWRLTNGEPKLMLNPADPDIHRARDLEKSVRRDSHKMKAFVRFREIPGEDDAYVAWFEPEHFIVDRVAPFFARRFAGMRWAIVTPYRSAYWNGDALMLTDGGDRSDVPAEDANEDLWRTYYANIFNPARLNPRMMRQEMAQKYWKNLPESHLLPELIRDAGKRVQEMAEREPEAPRRRIPGRPSEDS